MMRFLSALLASGLTLAAEPPPEMRLMALPLREAPTKAEAAQIELGRALFFDPILSATGTQSCATCHQPEHGWADGVPVATGLQRNTPTILNAGWIGLTATGFKGAPMFWDSREQTLEAQALHPIRSRDEMLGKQLPDSDAIPKLLQRLKASPIWNARFTQPINEAQVTSAIAAFERSLVTPDTAFDRFMRGDASALTASEKHGLQVFQQAGCVHCHGGPMLSDWQLHVIAAPGERRAFRTPSLRNLRHTAPYMHNGSMRTLDEVLVFYEQLMDEASETLDGGDASQQPPLDPLLKHLQLKPVDFPDLKAFLFSLSAERYDQRGAR